MSGTGNIEVPSLGESFGADCGSNKVSSDGRLCGNGGGNIEVYPLLLVHTMDMR